MMFSTYDRYNGLKWRGNVCSWNINSHYIGSVYQIFSAFRYFFAVLVHVGVLFSTMGRTDNKVFC